MSAQGLGDGALRENRVSMKLNESQKRAAAHKSGAMLVLAGPGSGKTSVITRRTLQLIEEREAAPSSILVVTFTKAAAREMKERFLQLCEGKYRQVTFGTFHGIFYGILRHAYGLTGENILGEEKKRQLLTELLRRQLHKPREEGDLLEAAAREISVVKNEGINPENYYSTSCAAEEFRELYGAYQDYLRENRLLDFDDILRQCYELFRQRPDILGAWQRKFTHVLVDEFQDINALQYAVVRMLAAPEDNLFIVGDDDQSIYRFRGAKPQIMLRFPKDYPQAQQVELEVNYRCPGTVVEAASRLISHNRRRFPKKLRAEKPLGEPVEILAFEDIYKERDWLIYGIQQDVKHGVDYEDIALLFRTNVGSRCVVEKLMEYNIPFQMRDVLPNLYEHWIARNILAYLRLALGGSSRSDFLQIMNRPNRYISREALSEPQVCFESLYEFYEDKRWMQERLENLEADLSVMGKIAPYGAINYLRYSVGYNEYLKEYAEYRHIKAEELYEILDAVQESSRSCGSAEEWFRQISQYTEGLKEQKRRLSQEGRGVTVSTLHSIKGLEYDHVYILDVNEGNMPYRKAVLEEDLEEERRMFYVGMTRAKKRLHLLYVKRQNDRNLEMSRFLKEIQEEEPCRKDGASRREKESPPGKKPKK